MLSATTPASRQPAAAGGSAARLTVGVAVLRLPLLQVLERLEYVPSLAFELKQLSLERLQLLRLGGARSVVSVQAAAEIKLDPALSRACEGSGDAITRRCVAGRRAVSMPRRHCSRQQGNTAVAGAIARQRRISLGLVKQNRYAPSSVVVNANLPVEMSGLENSLAPLGVMTSTCRPAEVNAVSLAWKAPTVSDCRSIVSEKHCDPKARRGGAACSRCLRWRGAFASCCSGADHSLHPPPHPALATKAAFPAAGNGQRHGHQTLSPLEMRVAWLVRPFRPGSRPKRPRAPLPCPRPSRTGSPGPEPQGPQAAQRRWLPAFWFPPCSALPPLHWQGAQTVAGSPTSVAIDWQSRFVVVGSVARLSGGGMRRSWPRSRGMCSRVSRGMHERGQPDRAAM